MRNVIATLQRSPYVLLILLAVSLGAGMLLLDLKVGFSLGLNGFAQQVATGVLLLILLSYQWLLFLKRVSRDSRNARKTLVRHRWVGVVITVLFAIHAVRFGYVWMSTLSAVVFLVALTGVLNREVMRYRSNSVYLIWLMCHIGLSAALVPLVAVHIWVALAYQ